MNGLISQILVVLVCILCFICALSSIISLCLAVRRRRLEREFSRAYGPRIYELYGRRERISDAYQRATDEKNSRYLLAHLLRVDRDIMHLILCSVVGKPWRGEPAHGGIQPIHPWPAPPNQDRPKVPRFFDLIDRGEIESTPGTAAPGPQADGSTKGERAAPSFNTDSFGAELERLMKKASNHLDQLIVSRLRPAAANSDLAAARREVQRLIDENAIAGFMNLTELRREFAEDSWLSTGSPVWPSDGGVLLARPKQGKPRILCDGDGGVFVRIIDSEDDPTASPGQPDSTNSHTPNGGRHDR